MTGGPAGANDGGTDDGGERPPTLQRRSSSFSKLSDELRESGDDRSATKVPSCGAIAGEEDEGEWTTSETTSGILAKSRGARNTKAKTEVEAVFLHGFLDSLHSWDLVWKHLEEGGALDGVAAHRITLPGWGDSDKAKSSEARFGVGSYAEEVLAFLDETTIAPLSSPPAAKKFVLFGHSMGSLVAERMAQLRPDRIAGLVLVGAAAKIDPGIVVAEDGTTIGDLRHLFASWHREGKYDEGVLRAFQLEDLRPFDVPAEFQEKIMEQTLKGSLAAIKCCWASIIDEDYSGEFDKISPATKAVVVWGTSDSLFPEAVQRELMGMLPCKEKRFVAIGSAPHGVLWTHPVEVANEGSALIRDILTSLTSMDGNS